MEAVLAYDGVSVAYDGRPVLEGVSCQVAAGRVLAIVGESGSGKSTLLRTALGLLGSGGAVTCGHVLYRGAEVTHLAEGELRALRGPEMALAFQDGLAALTPVRTVGAQFVEAARAHESVRGAVARDEVERRASELLSRMGVGEPDRVLASYPFQLSGGIGQRVGIALAMLLRPRVLLADEPTSALDTVSQKQVAEELGWLAREEGAAVVLVTHNLGLARLLADEVLVLDGGRVAEQGPAQEVLAHPRSACTRALVRAVPVLAPHSARTDGPAPAQEPGCKDVFMRTRDLSGADEPESGCSPMPADDSSKFPEALRASETGDSAPSCISREAPILEARGLRKEFKLPCGGTRVAVEGASLSIGAGECVGLVGPSGSGKSTLAGLILRLEDPTAGSVVLNGEDVTRAHGARLRKAQRSLQAVFQHPAASFDPCCTLGAALVEALRNAGVPRRRVRERAEELLELCGLSPEIARRYPRQVSGGQCQRAAIARALASEPKLLVCDEATSALDATVQRQIVELLARLRRELGMALLFISHDIALVSDVCDRVLVMEAGRIVEEGPTSRVLADPRAVCTKRLIDAVL